MATHETERRTTNQPVEARSVKGKPRVIQGYAAVFGSRSQPMGLQRVVETVAPSFFAKSKGDGWPGVTARYEHLPQYILASTRAHTLELRTDQRGLWYSAELTESRSDIWDLVSRGDVAGSSFSFNCYEDDFDFVNGETHRTLVGGKLIDVGPTCQPAYEDSSVTVLRSLASHVGAEYEEVRSLAAAGELRSLFIRTDIQVAAPPTIEPAGVTTMNVAEARKQLDSMRPKRITNKQRTLELLRIRGEWQRPPLTTAQARAELAEVRGAWAGTDPRENPR